MKILVPVFLCIVALALAACSKAFDSYGGKTGYGPRTETPATDVPDSGQNNASSDSRVRGNVYLDHAEILQLESYPVQVRLHVSGHLPTPCHVLEHKVTMSATAVNVELYSLVDPTIYCAQVLHPFDESIPLGSFQVADSTVLVNNRGHSYSLTVSRN